MLERRVDPDCVAGAILWDLYKQFYDAEHARIRVPYDTLCQIGSGGRACRPMRLGRGLGLAGRGAGLLICADRSCLVIRTAKSEPWPLGGLHATFVDILPIALHLPKIIPYGDDRAALLEVGGLDLKEACLSFELMSLAERRSGESDAEDVQRSLLAQVCWEATSWGSCLDGLPPLDPSGAWPAAFPVDPPSADLLASFQSRARQAAQFLLITESTLIEAVKLRIYSALPLQGGVSPARLSASFFSRSGDVLEALEHDRLVARLERMIFAPDAPCRPTGSSRSGLSSARTLGAAWFASPFANSASRISPPTTRSCTSTGSSPRRRENWADSCGAVLAKHRATGLKESCFDDHPPDHHTPHRDTLRPPAPVAVEPCHGSIGRHGNS